IAKHTHEWHREQAPSEFAPWPAWHAAVWFSRITFQSDRFFVLGALSREELVGFVSGYNAHRGSKASQVNKAQIYVDHISVLPAYQRQGIGRQLLKTVLDRATSLGFDRVSLDTWTFNTAAKALFASAGFEPQITHMSWRKAD